MPRTSPAGPASSSCRRRRKRPSRTRVRTGDHYAPAMNPVRWLAIRIGRQPWLHKYAKVIVGLDVLIQRLTRGRFNLLTLAGLPEVTLTVRGRKSGVPRSTPLLCVPHDGGWLVAGTNWGGPKMPAWVHNLGDADEASVAVQGPRVHGHPAPGRRRRARRAVAGDAARPGRTTRSTPSAPTARSRSSSSTRAEPRIEPRSAWPRRQGPVRDAGGRVRGALAGVRMPGQREIPWGRDISDHRGDLPWMTCCTSG